MSGSSRRSTLPAIARAAKTAKARARLDAVVGQSFGELVAVAVVAPGRVVLRCVRGHGRVVAAAELRKASGPRRCIICDRSVDAFGVTFDVEELAAAAGVGVGYLRRLLRRGERAEDLVARWGGRGRRPLDDLELRAAVERVLADEPSLTAVEIAQRVRCRFGRVLAVVAELRAARAAVQKTSTDGARSSP